MFVIQIRCVSGGEAALLSILFQKKRREPCAQYKKNKSADQYDFMVSPHLVQHTDLARAKCYNAQAELNIRSKMIVFNKCPINSKHLLLVRATCCNRYAALYIPIGSLVFKQCRTKSSNTSHWRTRNVINVMSNPISHRVFPMSFLFLN